MVEGYVAGLNQADEPLGVERTVATRTDKIAVSGRIDRLDARPELVVVDYKTGRHLLTTDDARSSMALALYALAAGRALRRPCHRVELHHLPTGDIIAWSHTEESLARHLSRAEDIAEECAAADERMRGGLPADRYDEVFPPRPGPSCAWCDYRRHCPEGAQAAPPAAPGTLSPPTDPASPPIPSLPRPAPAPPPGPSPAARPQPRRPAPAPPPGSPSPAGHQPRRRTASASPSATQSRRPLQPRRRVAPRPSRDPWCSCVPGTFP